jgi:hypothetical protein
MKRFLIISFGLLSFADLVTSAPRIDTDPNKDYQVTPEAGPWMICAASYRGPQAKELAHELVLEIRKKYGLPAFVIDRGGEERRKQEEEVRRIWKLAPEGRVKIVRVEEQYAVLIGGYKDMATARKALDDLKKQKPPDPKFCSEVREYGKQDGQDGIFIKKVSPFLMAFVARNPTVPPEPEPDAAKADPFLKRINEGESLSLLNNRKPWTLTVKVFGGPMMMQERTASGNKFMDMLGMGKGKDTLDAAALQAHAMAELLRKMKPVSFDAYVLHTRNQSIVTVGSYDDRNDPKLQQDQQTLSKLKLQGVPPEMQLWAQPMPMEVPRP